MWALSSLLNISQKPALLRTTMMTPFQLSTAISVPPDEGFSAQHSPLPKSPSGLNALVDDK